MQRVLSGSAVLCGLTLLGVCLVAGPSNVEARPKYKKLWQTKYKKVAEANDVGKKVKCHVCHVGKKKKNRNAYGKALKKILGEKNVKDTKKILEAFIKAEKEKSAVEGKTFGDLLKAAKLPASTK